jgi:hypothetical protein
MYKESDLTNIKCDKCQSPITYETVSFIGPCNGTCVIGKYHPTEYAVKCSRCRKGYGPWKKFDISLFPNFPDPNKCPCRELCHYCGFNEASAKCCSREQSNKDDEFVDDLYWICQTPGCGKEERICGHNRNVETQVKSNPKTPYYSIFSNNSIMDTILKPLKDYSNEKVNMFTYKSEFEPIDKLNLKALEYPFSFINKDYYELSEICTGLVDEEPINIGDFPNNIVEYYWIHEGTNDEENWHLFCKVMAEDTSDKGDADSKEAYVYYTAGCDYTGFDCQGDMKIYISRNAPALLYSLDRDVLDKLMSAKGICIRQRE